MKSITLTKDDKKRLNDDLKHLERLNGVIDWINKQASKRDFTPVDLNNIGTSTGKRDVLLITQHYLGVPETGVYDANTRQALINQNDNTGDFQANCLIAMADIDGFNYIIDQGFYGDGGVIDLLSDFRTFLGDGASGWSMPYAKTFDALFGDQTFVLDPKGNDHVREAQANINCIIDSWGLNLPVISCDGIYKISDYYTVIKILQHSFKIDMTGNFISDSLAEHNFTSIDIIDGSTSSKYVWPTILALGLVDCFDGPYMGDSGVINQQEIDKFANMHNLTNHRIDLEFLKTLFSPEQNCIAIEQAGELAFKNFHIPALAETFDKKLILDNTPDYTLSVTVSLKGTTNAVWQDGKIQPAILGFHNGEDNSIKLDIPGVNDSKKLTSSVDAIEKECQVTNSINNFTQYSFKVGADLDEDEKGKIKPSIFFEYTISAIENHMVKHSNESDLSIMLELEFKHSMTKKEFEQKFNNAMRSLVAQLNEIANAIEDPDTKAIEEWKKIYQFH